ncbi:MAG: hypothetical protein RBT64_11530 [Trichloromonas sp.]|jgi:hypothetical protein|nr:hypothetical protein [Trichloromonas sp.]
MCQWCADDRCRMCLVRTGCKKKLSMAEQIELFERLNLPKKEEHPFG